MSSRYIQSNRAFTLIEILVVIAIIGLLSTIVYASFSQARAQGRDRQRMSDLKTMQLNLRLYYEKYGRYPTACRGTSWSGDQTTNSFACSGGSDEYIQNLAPEFLSSLPTDPKPDSSKSNGFVYKVDSTGQQYKLMAYNSVESIKINTTSDQGARCPSSCNTTTYTYCDSSRDDFQQTYAVYSNTADAPCW